MIKNKKRFALFLLILLGLASGGVLAQIYTSGRSGFGGGRGGRGGSGFTTQRGMSGGRQTLPNQQFLNSRQSDSLFQWDADPEFPQDVFTFVRIAYDSSNYGNTYGNTGYGSMMSGRGGGRMSGMGMGGGRSGIDWPASDNNFSYRLHQLTSIEVNPEPVYIALDNPDLSGYPFIYIVEPGNMRLPENQVKILREYLLNGGFLMIDDFWRTEQWANVRNEMKRVFPDREPVLLTLEHPIFHCVFELKELPQIPAIDYAITSGDRLSGRTSESGDPPRYYGIYDDKGRMMVIICRDTDLGDGWEREGESHTFFKEFSEKKAYPLGINIVFYAMTH